MGKKADKDDAGVREKFPAETAEKSAQADTGAGESRAGFTRQQLLSSARYRNRRDLVSALLEDGRKYTLKEADQVIDRFMKGKVK